MAHLTDKPLGLQKMQRQLKTTQKELADALEVIRGLESQCEKLETEIGALSKALHRKALRKSDDR